MEPLVSVLMPVYNVDRYVSLAVKSVLNQSYTNLELLIVDDGSTDNTLGVVRELSQNDSRIRVFENKRNQNICFSLNRALENSKGELILRMDGDDVCEPDRLKTLKASLDENNNIQLVGSSISVIDEAGTKIGSSKYFDDQLILRKTLKYRTPVSHIWLARKSLYTSLGGYRNIPGAEDYDFLLRMVTSGFQFTNLENDYSYSVRIGREGNTVSTLGLKQFLLKRYVYGLYRMRKLNKKDNFSIEAMNKYITRSEWVSRLHSQSQEYFLLAYRCKSKRMYAKCFLYLVATCISPYQVLNWFERVVYHIVLLKGK